MSPRYWRRAVGELAVSDPVMGSLIEQNPKERLTQRGNPFHTLARAIVGQQISVAAAAGVWRRLSETLGEISPERVASQSVDDLRSAGVSRQKARYLNDLALHFCDGRLLPERWVELDDAMVIAELTQVKGVGRWTAEMFLIFHLMRPDVLPIGDLGLRRAISLHYNRGRALSDARLLRIARPWAPWRSVASWYLWRSLQGLEARS
jgi:DNA-3-methyladenine glycosylase II